MSKCKYQIWSEWRFCSKTVTHLSIPKSTSFSQHKLTVLVSCNVTTPKELSFNPSSIQACCRRMAPTFQRTTTTEPSGQRKRARPSSTWRTARWSRVEAGGSATTTVCRWIWTAFMWRERVRRRRVASSGKPFESTTATTHSRSQKWRFCQRHEEQNKRTTVICMTFSYCI